jgi:hypothetical protein
MVTDLVTKMATYSATATESCRRGGVVGTHPHTSWHETHLRNAPRRQKGPLSVGGEPADLNSLAMTYLSQPALTADAPFAAHRLWLAN